MSKDELIDLISDGGEYGWEVSSSRVDALAALENCQHNALPINRWGVQTREAITFLQHAAANWFRLMDEIRRDATIEVEEEDDDG